MAHILIWVNQMRILSSGFINVDTKKKVLHIMLAFLEICKIVVTVSTESKYNFFFFLFLFINGATILNSGKKKTFFFLILLSFSFFVECPHTDTHQPRHERCMTWISHFLFTFIATKNKNKIVSLLMWGITARINCL